MRTYGSSTVVRSTQVEIAPPERWASCHRDQTHKRLWDYLQSRRPDPAYKIRRTRYLAWRWMLIVTHQGHFVDETIHMTRGGAQRRGQRWIDEENARYRDLVDEVLREHVPEETRT